MLSFPTAQERIFFFSLPPSSSVGGGPNPLRFHFSTSPAALIQFRAYDCNTKTERVVKPETAMMNAPLLCVLVCFGGGVGKVGGGGGGAELKFMLTC